MEHVWDARQKNDPVGMTTSSARPFVVGSLNGLAAEAGVGRILPGRGDGGPAGFVGPFVGVRF